MAERPKREKVLTAADLKRKADRDALKAAREGKKSRLDSLVVRGMGWGAQSTGCVRAGCMHVFLPWTDAARVISLT